MKERASQQGHWRWKLDGGWSWAAVITMEEQMDRRGHSRSSLFQRSSKSCQHENQTFDKLWCWHYCCCFKCCWFQTLVVQHTVQIYSWYNNTKWIYIKKQTKGKLKHPIADLFQASTNKSKTSSIFLNGHNKSFRVNLFLIYFELILQFGLCPVCQYRGGGIYDFGCNHQLKIIFIQFPSSYASYFLHPPFRHQT